jgi:lactase-phlorizin hydrolase
MLKSVLLDGTKVKSYSLWTLMDNFQFTFGYTSTFGVYKTDFNDPARPRRAKDSAAFMKQIFTDNGFPAWRWAK